MALACELYPSSALVFLRDGKEGLRCWQKRDGSGKDGQSSMIGRVWISQAANNLVFSAPILSQLNSTSNLKLDTTWTLPSSKSYWNRKLCARLAQSVEHETLNLRVVGSSPTLGDRCVLFLTTARLIVRNTSAFDVGFLMLLSLLYLLTKQPFRNCFKNPPCSAGGRQLEPWSGRNPHCLGQLSPWATTVQPGLWRRSHYYCLMCVAL